MGIKVNEDNMLDAINANIPLASNNNTVNKMPEGKYKWNSTLCTDKWNLLLVL